MPLILELETAYEAAKIDPAFTDKMDDSCAIMSQAEPDVFATPSDRS